MSGIIYPSPAQSELLNKTDLGKIFNYLEDIQHAAAGSMPKPIEPSGSSGHPKRTFVIEP